MMNMFRKIEEVLKELGSVVNGQAKVTVQDNGFDLAIHLGSIFPVEAGETLLKLCSDISAELKQSGYENDGPFRYEVFDGEIVLLAEFYDEKKK